MYEEAKMERPPSPISQEMALLNETAERLSLRLENLYDRLDPALKPSVPSIEKATVTESAMTGAATSSLCSDLQKLNYRLARQSDRLAELAERIEL